MPERIDPLGKRALFWAPGPDEVAEGDPVVATARRPSPRRPLGARPASGASGRGRGGRSSPGPRPTGKRALFSAEEAVGRPRSPGPESTAAPAGTPRPAPGGVGAVRLDCATCGRRSTVDLVHFLRLHLPFFLWRPGPGFARFMTCPACRRRSWVSASWPAPVSPPTDL